MALTPDLVSRGHRVDDDAGQEPGLGYQTEEEYDAAFEVTLASYPAVSLRIAALFHKPSI